MGEVIDKYGLDIFSPSCYSSGGFGVLHHFNLDADLR
jgi:hypothetical protein